MNNSKTAPRGDLGDMPSGPAREMPRVLVTRQAVGLFCMQVCAVSDAADAEILEVCNRENPSGTELGWCSVIRDANDDLAGPRAAPVMCEKYQERVHFLVSC